jgi:hypothetical protein
MIDPSKEPEQEPREDLEEEVEPGVAESTTDPLTEPSASRGVEVPRITPDLDDEDRRGLPPEEAYGWDDANDEDLEERSDA